jgi:TfoX/Sxy family transcriptional regulator of competence genes
MAYDEYLADRIRRVLKDKNILHIEKKMMGGLCYMVDDKMCFGIVKNEFMARIGPDEYQNALLKEGCKEMNFTGRAMNGYVFLDPIAMDTDEELEYWIDLCMAFNPFAVSSKKKKKN